MRTKKARKPISDIKKGYIMSKSVMNGVKPADVDKEVGGFAFAPLLPFLAALGIPALSSAGKWIGKKLFGEGILRAGDRRGKGILQAGARGAGILRAGDMRPSISMRGAGFRSGDITLPASRVSGGALFTPMSKEAIREKLIPYIKTNDPQGFKKKVMQLSAEMTS